MAKESAMLSVTELERMLDAKKSQLQDLNKEKTRLEKDLDRVNRKIQDLAGKGGGRRKVKRRVRNTKSLHSVVQEVLSKSKKGYTLGELSDKVLATGYQSGSSNFNNVVYQCVYNSDVIQHDPKTKTYKLVKKANA